MTTAIFCRQTGRAFRRSGLTRGLGERDARLRRAPGVSVSTSAAGLSSRSPLNAAWRTMPSPVQPANSISATSSGLSPMDARLVARRADRR